MMSTKNLHVIKASAGAGKTYTLAKVYIEQLLWDKSGKLRPLHSCYHQSLYFEYCGKVVTFIRVAI